MGGFGKWFWSGNVDVKLETLMLSLENYQNGIGCLKGSTFLNGSFVFGASYQIDNAIWTVISN